MTDTTDPHGEQMAADLIAHIKRTHTPRLALLEDRIAATLYYLEGVTEPDTHTLSHVRRFLNGTRDGILSQYLPPKENGS